VKYRLTKIVFIFLLLILDNNNLFAQYFSTTVDYSNPELKPKKQHSLLYSKTQGEAATYIIIGALVVLLATPTVIYEDKKIYFGLGRELYLAFGKNGEFRISAEYTFIFRNRLKHHFRAAAKYDILSNLERSVWFDSRTFISIGAGYFIDAEGSGIFPEVSAGARIGEGDFYLFPYIKIRHTFMTKKDKPDNTDLSLGMAIGLKLF